MKKQDTQDSMTPEQIARAIVAESDWCNCTLASGEINLDRLRAHIAAAIRADRERLLSQVIAYLNSHPGQSKVGYAVLHTLG